MPKYSFIIPVYNVEKYLRECIDSILSQTYKDYEIILVDDGSKDSSGSICDEYAEKNEAVRVIHQENAGLSMARNNGVKASLGEFIIFLDSDDYWYYDTALEDINDIISSDTDVVIFSSYNLDDSTKKLYDDRYNYSNVELNNYDSETCLEYMISNGLFNVHAAKKVFNKQFFVSNDLFYKPGIKSEDIEQWIRAVCNMPNYKFLNKRIYVYRNREGSISNTINKKHLCDYYGIIKQYCRYNYPSERIRALLLSYIAYQYILLSANTLIIKPKGYKKMLNVFSKYAFLFKYDSYPRTKKVSRLYYVFGYRITIFVISIMLKHRASIKRLLK